MNNIQKTMLFFMVSIYLLFFGFNSYQQLTQMIFVILYVAYIVFCVWVIRGVKIRFLAYPTLVMSLSMGVYFFAAAGVSDANATGLGFLLIFGFMFWILPLMIIALIVGGILDIIELINKNKNKVS